MIVLDGILRIRAPYTAAHCSSVNETVLRRIQTLLIDAAERSAPADPPPHAAATAVAGVDEDAAMGPAAAPRRGVRVLLTSFDVSRCGSRLISSPLVRPPRLTPRKTPRHVS